jgi:hypothetical protein
VAASRQRHGRPITEIDAALEAALGKGKTAETQQRVGLALP